MEIINLNMQKFFGDFNLVSSEERHDVEPLLSLCIISRISAFTLNKVDIVSPGLIHFYCPPLIHLHL